MSRTPLRYGAQRLEPRQDPAIQRFRDHRLGMFIHFGLYSLPAGSWQGVEYAGAAEFLPKAARIPAEQWRDLAAGFSLPAFDPGAWADAATRMGAGYVTITTKHHEGFCLWPTAHTDFHVGNTPYGKDLLGELVAAFGERGIAVHLYYSVLDWDHPDWRHRIEGADDAAAFERYLRFARDQVVELARRFPQVRGFWFDGTWDDSVKANGGWTLEIENTLKDLLPGVVVNSRLRADEHGARHFDSNGDLMGDYESGYERRLPDPWDSEVTTRDWEACMTIPEHTWGFHAGEWARRTRKHPWELADMLAQCTAQGGNILVNVGPRGDGSLDPEEIVITDRLGTWVHRHSPAIHGAGPVADWGHHAWGHLTAPQSDEVPATVHAIVTRPPASQQVVVQLPAGVVVDDVTTVAGPDQPPGPIAWQLRASDKVVVTVDAAAIAADGPAVFAIHLAHDRTAATPEGALV